MKPRRNVYFDNQERSLFKCNNRVYMVIKFFVAEGLKNVKSVMVSHSGTQVRIPPEKYYFPMEMF